MDELRIELFGGLSVFANGIQIAQEITSRAAARDLLALLVLEKGRCIDTDTLAARLWPESEPWRALENLYAATYKLRKQLGDCGNILINQRQLYRIDNTKISTDVADFDRLARIVTFAEGIDTEVKGALSAIEEIYKGDLLGRGGVCRNQRLRAYNEEYKKRLVGVWRIAAGLYLEQGDDASKVKAGWYAENIRRLQSQETISTQSPPSKHRRGKQNDRRSKADASRPSIRSQLAEGRQQIATSHAELVRRSALKSSELEVL
jgi:two-component SAPR family response regulator